MYFLVTSHLCTQNSYDVTNKNAACLDRLVWVRFVVDLLGSDRAESPEVFWDGSTDIGPEYNDNSEV